eukprot:m.14690 g.14690  ORF g.14690 m.14690 type:complete len:181 (+) comp5188_c0_seq1:1002-1544(+)
MDSFDESGNLLQLGCESHIRGLSRCRKLVHKLIQRLSRCGWDSRDVYMFGFSQGGTVVLDFVISTSFSMGGAISVSGPLFEWHTKKEHRQTKGEAAPLLLTLGCKDPNVSMQNARQVAKKLRSSGLNLEISEFERGHGMPNTKDEMRTIHGVLSSRFRLRNIALEKDPDVYEVSQLEKDA